MREAQKQHVEKYRKVLLRKRLLRWAEPGVFYVPFIGDGDIAAELYPPGRVMGADIDPARVEAARAALPGATVVEADCTSWVFPQLEAKVAVADFDAYSDPYTSFKSFLGHAPLADRLVVFFTDGMRQGFQRGISHVDGGKRTWKRPDGTEMVLTTVNEMRVAYNFYLGRFIWPWFEGHVAGHGYSMVHKVRYVRGLMVYWGAVIDR